MDRIIICVHIIFSLCFCNDLLAQPGVLDMSFGGRGAFIYYQGGSTRPNSVAITDNGKILLSAYSSQNNGANTDYTLFQFETNGSIDEFFGPIGGGISGTDFSNMDEAKDVLLQPDGKIIAAGYTVSAGTAKVTLVRYNSFGTIDYTFGVNGKSMFLVPGSNVSEAKKVLLQPDGKIIVAGLAIISGERSGLIARFNSSGGIDSSFANGGYILTEYTSEDEEANAIALQTDGKIVVGGFCRFGSLAKSFTARFESNGMPDFSFNGNGVQIITSFYASISRDIVIQSDEKIGTLITVSDTVNGFSCIMRFNTDGSLDDNFGDNGVAISDTNQTYTSLVIQPDGKLIAGGSIYKYPQSNFVVARYNTNGTHDASFGNGGIVVTDIDTLYTDYLADLGLQHDGKLVAVGYSGYNSNNNQIALVRYITGLNLGLLDFSEKDYAVSVYPNPIKESATLEYELMNDEDIEIYISDLQGRIIKNLISEKQSAGKQAMSFRLPEGLISGSYLLVISSANGNRSIQIMK